MRPSSCVRLSTLAAVILCAGAMAPAPVSSTIPRFARDPSPIALTGPARPQRYMEASGRRAAFLGREDGSFEAWVYPLKVLHGREADVAGGARRAEQFLGRRGEGLCGG